ncbi:MAG TPA: DUF1844 domain-containing protein [Bryobacteraceae bacterium]|jgi:hypothetical protein
MSGNEANPLFPGPEDNDRVESRPALPAADFDFLVYSLRLQTELNLGLLPFGALGEEPGDEDSAPDFELAGHNIDLLAMLQEKTKGNLTSEEQLALDNSVAELRVRFVQVQKAESKPQ